MTMHLQSLKSKLLIGVAVLVIGSGVLISLLVTHRYSRSLSEALAAQAEYLTHAVALEAADLVLTNDLVALQKMLDHQVRSNPSLSYLFILKDGQVLAHTFTNGVPVDLLTANEAVSATHPHLQEIASMTNEYFLDMALPVFEGKAGILRLGFSEKPYRQQVTKLWVQMAFFTLGILFLALAGGLFFIRRITGPLTELALAADQVDRGELGTRVSIRGHDEVAALATSFNHMLNSLQTYTRRLEEQTTELERAHGQTRTFCGIVQEIGALQNLKEIGVFLIKQFQSIVKCRQMVFLVLTDARDRVFMISEERTMDTMEPEFVRGIATTLEELDCWEKPAFTRKLVLPAALISQESHAQTRQAVVPLRQEQHLFGAMIMTCPEKNDCSSDEIDLVGLMLNQAAAVIKRAVLHEEEIRNLQSRLESSTEFCGIISKDSKMQVIFQLIEDIAPTDATVLIQGESGTGKELVARAIHEQSPRKDKPFVVIDCSAYPATLLESELFGHEKGAFTGAVRQKSGRFEQANGGSVFLDEIGEIPLSAQIKLLRVLQTQRFERLGGEKTLTVDVRIIAATNRNLLEEVKEGQFREDLYYRLNVIPLQLPPLAKRRNDVPLLAEHFLRRFALAHRKTIESFSPETMRVLLDHPWPGNVRELENTIEHAVVLSKGPRIETSHLPAPLRTASSSPPPADRSSTIVQHERKLLLETMEACGWNKKRAAHRLGISRSTLYEKLRKYEIKPPTQH
jgi:DNA-binding NtrC family response regulator/HAMP domain-containing protein